MRITSEKSRRGGDSAVGRRWYPAHGDQRSVQSLGLGKFELQSIKRKAWHKGCCTALKSYLKTKIQPAVKKTQPFKKCNTIIRVNCPATLFLFLGLRFSADWWLKFYIEQSCRSVCKYRTKNYNNNAVYHRCETRLTYINNWLNESVILAYAGSHFMHRFLLAILTFLQFFRHIEDMYDMRS